LTAVFLGIGEAGSLIFESSIQSDCVEYDQLVHGTRREAQFETTKRLGWAIADTFNFLPIAVIAALDWRYSTGMPNNSLGVIIALKCFLAGIVILTIIQALIMMTYPINRAIHAKIKEGILVHKESRVTIDPVRQRFIKPPQESTIPKPIKQVFDNFPRWELRKALYKGPWILFRYLLAQTIIGAIVLGGCVVANYYVSLQQYTTGEFLWLYTLVISCTVVSVGFSLWNFIRLPASLKLPVHYQFVNIYLFERQTSGSFADMAPT